MSYPTNPDFKSVSRRCEGYGTLACDCGGDLCVCGLDGEQCPGCPDCDLNDDADADYFGNGICGCGEPLTDYGNCPYCDPR